MDHDALYAYKLESTNRVGQSRYDQIRAESNARMDCLLSEVEKLQSEVAELSMDKTMGYLTFSCCLKDWVVENQGKGYMHIDDLNAALDHAVAATVAASPASLKSSEEALRATGTAPLRSKPAKRPLSTQYSMDDDDTAMEESAPATPIHLPALPFSSPFTPNAKRRCVSTPV